MVRLFAIWLLFGVSYCFSCINYCYAEIPPAPFLPELGRELREKAFIELDHNDYHQRESAQKLLVQGSAETVLQMRTFFKTASLEGKIRALQIANRIHLKLLREQMDKQAIVVQKTIDEIRIANHDLLGSRLDEFRAIHLTLFERASARVLTRLNAVIEYRTIARNYPGLPTKDFAVETPLNIFIGENWIGSQTDLRHISVLLNNIEGGNNARIVYRIKGCPVALKELQNLAAGLSRVSVDERSRARLGIGSSASFGFQNWRWKVTQVQPGAPAALAGIRIDDVIVRNQSKIVNTFNDLVQSLHHSEPGDRIELELFRSTVVPEVIELTVPEQVEKLGIELDKNFLQFNLIKLVKKDSVAQKAGMTSQHCILDVQNKTRPEARLGTAEAELEAISPGDKLKITVMRLKTVTVRLRGWVGPYR